MPEPSKRVYLDYAATAPFDTRLTSVFDEASWANANSLHSEGRQAALQLNNARKNIAAVLGAHAPSEIIFTSGGSESDNMALKGLVKSVPGAAHTHVIVSSIEHDAVLNAAASLKASGFKLDKIDPDSRGVITPQALDELLSRIEQSGDATALVAIHMVNNEIGSVQPIAELAGIAHEHKSLFFTDGVQALGKVDIALEQCGVDACAFSAHKIGALKGSGILYLRRGVRLTPLIHGGGQEAKLRSGTSNVPAALCFARAIEYATGERERVWDHVTSLRARLFEGLGQVNCTHALRSTLRDDSVCVPHIISLLCDGLEGETLVLRFDNAGFAVSSGSACSSGSLDPSHVLSALGVPRDDAFGSLRLSMGAATTMQDIEAFLQALPEVLR